MVTGKKDGRRIGEWNGLAHAQRLASFQPLNQINPNNASSVAHLEATRAVQHSYLHGAQMVLAGFDATRASMLRGVRLIIS